MKLPLACPLVEFVEVWLENLTVLSTCYFSENSAVISKKPDLWLEAWFEDFLSLLRRSMHGCSKEAKKRAYVALARPHLEWRIVINLRGCKKWAARWAYCQWDHHAYTWSHTYEEACKHFKRWKAEEWCHHCAKFIKIIHNLDWIPFNSYFAFNTNCTRSHWFSLVCSLACWSIIFVLSTVFVSGSTTIGLLLYS